MLLSRKKSNKLKSIQLKYKFILLAILSFSSFIGNQGYVVAQSNLVQSNSPAKENSQQIQVRFIAAKKDPPVRGKTPPAQEGTGSRGSCLYKENKPPLTRLTGSSNLQTTVDEHPQVLIYTPYSSEEVQTANFSLQLGDDEIYQANINLPKKAGIFAIALPSSAPVLQFDKNYRWYLDIDCPSANKSRNSVTPASLTGVIRRVKPGPVVSKKLQVAKTPIERIRIYAQHGIWINAVNELAKERVKAPLDKNLKEIWVSLLSQPEVGLKGISQEPIVIE